MKSNQTYILHLITFKFGTLYTATYGDAEIRDLHRLVIEVFQSPIYVAWYILSLIALGVHLSHGVASAFKTLGFFNKSSFSVISS